jgi:hypothetical protein
MIYKLCRTVTFNEYAIIEASSQAEARLKAHAYKRVPVKQTKWQIMRDIPSTVEHPERKP